MVVKSVLRPTTPHLGRPEPNRSPLLLDRKSSPEHGTSPQPARYPLIYGCVHCGVKFSNPRTLAAHVEFYCSKKVVAPDPSPDANSGDGLEIDRLSHKSDEGSYKQQRAGSMDLMLSQMKREQLSPASSRRSDGDRSATSTPKEKHARRLSSGDDSADAPAHKMAKTGHAFQCPFCSYSSDKKISLNRHLRMHNSSDDSNNSRSQTTSPDMQDFSTSENFCRECNIQFSSRKTFFGHKEYYCATRQGRTMSGAGGEEEGVPSAPSTATVAAAAQAGVELQQQMAAFLPTQAAAYVVQSFLRSPGASQTMNTLHGQHPAIVVATPMIAPSTMANINTPTVILQPVIAMPPNMTTPAHQGQVLTPRGSSPGFSLPAIASSSRATSPHSDKAELPLDLSCRRETPIPVRPVSVEPDSVPRSPSRESSEPQKDNSEPQDLSVKREWRTLTSDRSPQAASPAGREPSLGHRTPEQPPEGVTAVPSPTAELLVAQAQVMNMMSQHAAAMMLAPPNISKCLECNIVFYKHENFLIHKEHYCAGRRISKRERMLAKELSPGGPIPSHHTESRNGSLTPTSESRSSGNVQSLSPRHITPPAMTPPVGPAPGDKPDIPPPVEQAFLQFYCIPCKIKFSSIDTLTAHQEFYCPFNKENRTENGLMREHRTSPRAASTPEQREVSPGSQPDSGSGSDAPDNHEGDAYACPHCGHTYPTYRLLKLHFCKAPSAHMPLLRCPYCEFITQSDNRLVEHIKGHAPTKAYRCTICGYRGNTVRGMRMHGKTHVDEGQPFSDENMVEYEEPPLIPRRHRTAAVEANPVNMEAELIRLKNEPYKRRRSRKGYEKSENFSPIRRQAPHVCMTCSEAFADTTRLRQHMRVHMQEATYACRSCDLITNDKASLVRHVKRVHESRLRSANEDSNDNMSESADVLSRNTDSIDSNISMKKEVADETEDRVSREPERTSHGDIADSPHRLSPETCPVQEQTTGTDERHSSSPEVQLNGQTDPELAIVIKPDVESDVNQNRCPSNKSNDRGKSPPSLSPIFTRHADAENMNTVKDQMMTSCTPPTNQTKRPRSPSPQLAMPTEPPSNQPTTPLSPVNGKAELRPTELLLQKKGDKSGSNYCKQCDITFVYMSSFIAHKRYYCSSHAGERECAQSEVSYT